MNCTDYRRIYCRIVVEACSTVLQLRDDRKYTELKLLTMNSYSGSIYSHIYYTGLCNIVKNGRELYVISQLHNPDFDAGRLLANGMNVYEEFLEQWVDWNDCLMFPVDDHGGYGIDFNAMWVTNNKRWKFINDYKAYCEGVLDV